LWHSGAVTDEIEIIHLNRLWQRPQVAATGFAACGAYDVPDERLRRDPATVTCPECLRRQRAVDEVRAAMTARVSVVIR
jgi:hypothetical protein